MQKSIPLMSLLLGFVMVSPGQSQSPSPQGETATASSAAAVSGDALSLSAAIKTALDNNPEIKSASARIKASRGRTWSAVSPAPAELSITNDDIPVGEGMDRYGVQTVGVSQSVEFPTNYILRGSKSAKERGIAESELESVRISVISNVKRSYFNVAAQQKQTKIAQENLAITQDFVHKAEVRYSAGEGTNLERLTAKVNYTEALNNVETRKNHLITAFAELNLAMGNGTSTTYRLTDTLLATPFDFTLDQLANDAASMNPQLKAGKLRVDANTAERTLAWSSLLPTTSLAYFTKRVKDDANGYYGASLTLSIPLWFMLDQNGRIQEACANASTAKSELQTTANAVYAKTHAAFAEFKNEERQIRLYVEDILPQAEEVFRTATKSYEVGEITYIEFLQAQQTLISARGNYVDALLSYNLSIVALEDEVGKNYKQY